MNAQSKKVKKFLILTKNFNEASNNTQKIVSWQVFNFYNCKMRYMNSLQHDLLV